MSRRVAAACSRRRGESLRRLGLASLPADAKQALRARVYEAASAYQTPTGIEFPGLTLLAAGRRADTDTLTAA